MLSMEQKEKFLNGIRRFNDDERLVQDWVWEENEILRHQSELDYAKEQGLEQGIKQGIEKGIEQGIEKGIEEKTRKVIISMLKEEIDIANYVIYKNSKKVVIRREKQVFKIEHYKYLFLPYFIYDYEILSP